MFRGITASGRIKMNSRNSFYDISSFYDKKGILSASFQGMRYRVEQFERSEDSIVLRVVVWPEPFAFDKTPEEYKTYKEFSYEESGLDEAYKWICDCYDERTEEWEFAARKPMEQAAKMGVV